jgi:hypothetical protein
LETEWESQESNDHLPDLSMAEWCALIALKRASNKHPEESINFDMLFTEYSQGFAASAKINDGALIARKFSRTVMRAALDMLVGRGIVQSAKSEMGETIDTRETLLARIPLVQIPELLSRFPNDCPSPLKKLAAESLQ